MTVHTKESADQISQTAKGSQLSVSSTLNSKWLYTQKNLLIKFHKQPKAASYLSAEPWTANDCTHKRICWSNFTNSQRQPAICQLNLEQQMTVHTKESADQISQTAKGSQLSVSSTLNSKWLYTQKNLLIKFHKQPKAASYLSAQPWTANDCTHKRICWSNFTNSQRQPAICQLNLEQQMTVKGDMLGLLYSGRLTHYTEERMLTPSQAGKGVESPSEVRQQSEQGGEWARRKWKVMPNNVTKHWETLNWLSISRVPDHNGVSRAWYIEEIHHSGRKPSIYLMSVGAILCCVHWLGYPKVM